MSGTKRTGLGRSAWRAPALALAVAALAAAAAAEARTVVLRASGPSAGQFRTGQILREPLRLQLKPGDLLMVMDDQGTRELRGPATVDDTAPRRPAQARPVKWSDLVGSRMRPETGGVRGMKRTDRPAPQRPVTRQDRLWSVDTAVAGNWCAVEFADLGLWRADAAAPGQVAIAPEGGAATTATFAAGASDAAWPAAAAVRDGGVYTLRNGTGAPVKITLHRVTPGASTESLATALADKGCFQQLAILLES